jgi:rhodanese-related sulfurtransferase
VRPENEFALGHLPGAVNIPLRKLEMRLAEFDAAQESLPTAVVLIVFFLMRRSPFYGRSN